MKTIIINNKEYKLIPYGYCYCGCGKKTNISKENGNGYKKGEPKRYFYRHQEKLKNHHLWKGGRVVDKSGYILIYNPEHPRASYGYVREHILVMEEAIGRQLKKEEIVHHIDEDKGNNYIGNLILFANGTMHKKFHNRLLAFKICGHYDWRKCKFCKNYDDISNMHENYNKRTNCYNYYHKKCQNLYQLNKRRDKQCH